MKFVDFNVYDYHNNLIEILPAILYFDGNDIVAQVPSGTSSVVFTQVSNGQTTTETPTNNKATFAPPMNDTYRVGSVTISKHNEVTLTQIKSLNDVKNDKLAELQSAYQAKFTTFQSATLGTTNTYPIDEEAQKNLDYYVKIAAANPNKSTFNFKTIEQGIVPHTRTQFLQLVEDAEAFEINLDKQYETYENQINSATDKPTLQSMTFIFS